MVGITENMNVTLKVLEAKMPEYFAGAHEEYFDNVDVRKWRHINSFKLPVSEEVKGMLIEKFKHELDFYYFCYQRLQRQYDLIRNKVI